VRQQFGDTVYNVTVLLAREEIGVVLGVFLTFFVFSNGIRVVDDHINCRALLVGHIMHFVSIWSLLCYNLPVKESNHVCSLGRVDAFLSTKKTMQLQNFPTQSSAILSYRSAIQYKCGDIVIFQFFTFTYLYRHVALFHYMRLMLLKLLITSYNP